MIFTDEEKRYIKYNLGLDPNFANLSMTDLAEIYSEASGDITHMGLRDRVIIKVEALITED